MQVNFFRHFSYQHWWWKIALFDLAVAAALLVYVATCIEPMPLRGVMASIVSSGVLFSLLRVAWHIVLLFIYLWRRQWNMAILTALHGTGWWCVYRLIGYTATSIFSTGVG